MSCVLSAGASLAVGSACFANEGRPVAHVPATAATPPARGAVERFIVTYRPDAVARTNRTSVVQTVNAAAARAMADVGRRGGASSAKATPLTATYLRKLATGAELVRVSRKLAPAEASALIAQIATDAQVLRVQADVMVRAIADVRAPVSPGATAFAPSDPYFARYQWHFRAGDGAMQTVGNDTAAFPNLGGADIAKAWDLADGTSVTVAVIDTGLTHHPDIDTSLGDAGYDFISDANVSGRPTDDRSQGGWDLGDWTTPGQCSTGSEATDSSWHGTHVAGTIAELTNNSVGMAGAAFKAKLLPVRALGHCGGYTSDIADAIEWASGGHVDGVPDNTHPAGVINMSLGGEGTCDASDVTGTAIADAMARGATVVVAAGNSAEDAAGVSPASCPGAITIASIGIMGRRAVYSNFGSTVALAAPGGGVFANDGDGSDNSPPVDAGFVWSAVNASSTAPDEGAYGYAGYAGTSQATPHVAATVALVMGALKGSGAAALTPQAMRTVLLSTARPFPATPDHAIGAGIIDADAAVLQAAGGSGGGGGGGGNDGSTAIALANGVPVVGNGASSGGALFYKVVVPASARALVIRTFGGAGDVSLYVSKDTVPTVNTHDAASVHGGNNESVVNARPAAGTYYVLVTDAKNLGNFQVTVQASWTAPAP